MNRLIYKSSCCSVVDWKLINSILETSERNNSEHGISGVLVATETKCKNTIPLVVGGSGQVFSAPITDP